MNFRIGTCATLLAFAGMLPTGVLAQSYAVDRGSVLIDGQASFTSTGAEVNGEEADDRVTQLSISPSLQYFLLPGLAVGGEIRFSRRSDEDDTSWAYGIGPAVTYYFGAAADRYWYPYLGATFQLIREERNRDEGPDPADITTRGYKGAAGAVFMISRSVGFNVELFYQVFEQELEDSDAEFEANTYGLAIGISAFVF
jgi:hypothetical protein